MPKQVPPNAVLVKKHNKMIGKKWILNMVFLEFERQEHIRIRFFRREKEGFNNHITR